MSHKQRLELDWVGKDEVTYLEPRIFVEDENLSYGKNSDHNKIIKGDNLLALKALESNYSGQIKCVFIDPPYNTGSAFSYYEDGLEHSLWLSLISERLNILRKLLAEDGSIWITLDDNEHPYLRVLCDEIFGRSNFVSNLVWQKRVSPANDAKYFSSDHDYIIVYAKDKTLWKPNRLERTAEQNKLYKNLDNDKRGPWNSVTYTCSKNSDERPNLYYAIKNPNTGEEIWPKKTAVWKYGQETTIENLKNNLLYWGKDGKSKSPRYKKFLSDVGKVVPRSVWSYSDVGHTQEAQDESKTIFPDSPFPTPKPERLLKRIIEISTNEGDVILDSFAGSGTTGAVAHKMNRNWIQIELGDHAESHIVPRMKKVIDGKDALKISDELNWKGGGGFSFFNLAPSLLRKDERGNWIINDDYNAIQLTEAVCKHEKFKFHPDESLYWKQGFSSERDFIFVTTQFLTSEHLDSIQSQMKKDESLLICAKAFRVKRDKYPDITLKKIPQILLGRCEFGKDDYSLNIIEPIQEELDMSTEA